MHNRILDACTKLKQDGLLLIYQGFVSVPYSDQLENVTAIQTSVTGIATGKLVELRLVRLGGRRLKDIMGFDTSHPRGLHGCIKSASKMFLEWKFLAADAEGAREGWN